MSHHETNSSPMLSLMLALHLSALKALAQIGSFLSIRDKYIIHVYHMAHKISRRLSFLRLFAWVFSGVPLKNMVIINENQELSWCQRCHHWWQRWLSLWQGMVPPAAVKLASWQLKCAKISQPLTTHIPYLAHESQPLGFFCELKVCCIVAVGQYVI